ANITSKRHEPRSRLARKFGYVLVVALIMLYFYYYRTSVQVADPRNNSLSESQYTPHVDNPGHLSDGVPEVFSDEGKDNDEQDITDFETTLETNTTLDNDVHSNEFETTDENSEIDEETLITIDTENQDTTYE